MPGRPHLSTLSRLRLAAGTILLGSCLVLTGCSAPVAVDDPTPSSDVRNICAAVMANLPDTVLDESRREVQPGKLSGAWGNPPIVLRCGVSTPPGMTRASECFEVNGVGWYAEEADGGRLFTTLGRPALIEVGVPNDYAPEANALVDLAAAINKHNPVKQPCV